MMTSCHGNAKCTLMALYEGNPPVRDGRIPLGMARVLLRSFGVVFVVCLNKLLNKQLMCRWFETPWRPRDITVMVCYVDITAFSLTSPCSLLPFSCTLSHSELAIWSGPRAYELFTMATIATLKFVRSMYTLKKPRKHNTAIVARHDGKPADMRLKPGWYGIILWRPLSR